MTSYYDDIEKQLGILEEERDELRLQLFSTQEMFAHVLKVTGEVLVPDEQLVKGLHKEDVIYSYANPEKQGYVIGVGSESEVQ